MSSRPQFSPASIITNQSMAGTASIISQVTIIQKLSYISYSVSWTGTPVGAFSVEVSNDYELNPAGGVINSGTWTPLTLTGSPNATGSAGTGFIDIDGCAAYAMRLKYVNASGSGVLNAMVNAKVA